MATFKEITEKVLAREQLPENTISDSKVQSELLDYQTRQNAMAFGILSESKILNFFNLSEVYYNVENATTKGNSLKMPLCESYAYAWLHKYLSGGVITNHAIAQHEDPNSGDISDWIFKNRISEQYENVFRTNHNVGKSSYKIQVWDEVTVSGNTITYTQPHILSANDTITIRNTDYIVSTEDTEGLQYTLDNTPDQGTQQAGYLFDFNALKFPFLRLKNLSKIIN